MMSVPAPSEPRTTTVSATPANAPTPPRAAWLASPETRDAIAAEWRKLVSLRSQRWSFPVYLMIMVFMSAAYGLVGRGRRPEDLDPVGLGLTIVPLGMLVLVVVAVLSVTAEYSSGTIHASLLAVPDRRRFYVAKVAVAAGVSAAVSLVGAVAGFVTVQVLLGERGVGADVAVVGHVLGAVCYTVLLVVFSVGVAAVLRSSAATLSTLIPLFFMVSTILAHIPAVSTVAQFLPDVAGGRVLEQQQDSGVLGPWSGLGVLLVWSAVSFLAGLGAVTRRDP